MEDEEEEKKVVEFLKKLKSLDSSIFFYQKDTVLNSPFFRDDKLGAARALDILEFAIKKFEGSRAPFQGLNVGDAKNMSYAELEKITDSFCEDNNIVHIRYATLFNGFMDDGEGGKREVTVKTWDFVFPSPDGGVGYPRKLYAELVLLERSPFKSHPFFPKLIGFCFEKKLAVVYDLKFKTLLSRSLHLDDFGWKERMKVATNYASLLKTLTERQIVHWSSSVDIMVDEEYNITLVNCGGCEFPRYAEDGTWDSAPASDDSLEKSYVKELGILLLELITKRFREWDRTCPPGAYIDEQKKSSSSVVHETLKVDNDIGTQITELISLCVRDEPAERPRIESVVNDLASIVG